MDVTERFQIAKRLYDELQVIFESVIAIQILQKNDGCRAPLLRNQIKQSALEGRHNYSACHIATFF